MSANLEEAADADEQLRRRLAELGAKPWRGACALCRFSLWFGDTEDEVRQLVEGHVAEEHGSLVSVWQEQRREAG